MTPNNTIKLHLTTDFGLECWYSGLYFALSARHHFFNVCVLLKLQLHCIYFQGSLVVLLFCLSGSKNRFGAPQWRSRYHPYRVSSSFYNLQQSPDKNNTGQMQMTTTDDIFGPSAAGCWNGKVYCHYLTVFLALSLQIKTVQHQERL